MIRYAWAVLVLSVMAAVGISTYSLNRAEGAVRAERQARLDADAARRAQGQALLGVLCDLIKRQEDVFQESTAKVGKNAADAWHDLGVTYHCYTS